MGSVTIPQGGNLLLRVSSPQFPFSSDHLARAFCKLQCLSWSGNVSVYNGVMALHTTHSLRNCCVMGISLPLSFYKVLPSPYKNSCDVNILSVA
jgi:hypothetical protein